MNDVITGIILGFVQGITEFLPVSSSGHLIVFRDFLGIEIANSLLFDVLLHLATALAIIVYFRADIVGLFKQPREHRVLWLAIILGTIPAALLGLFLGDSYRSSSVVAIGLIVGSILFIIAEKFATQNKPLSLQKGIFIGAFQALALIPGMSRSGSTISGGLLLGMKRDEAAKFSFFLGLPIIMGAGLLEVVRSFEYFAGGQISMGLIVGVITAFVTGVFSIHFLLQFLRNHTLIGFAWYRIILAILILLFI